MTQWYRVIGSRTKRLFKIAITQGRMVYLETITGEGFWDYKDNIQAV